jgi:hypothetical protein
MVPYGGKTNGGARSGHPVVRETDHPLLVTTLWPFATHVSSWACFAASVKRGGVPISVGP